MRLVELVLLFWLGACLVLTAIYLALQEAAQSRHERRCRERGTRRDGGSRKRSASTTERARGTQTRAMATTAVCNSVSAPGGLLADAETLHALGYESSYTARGWSTGGTATRGASGARRERAV